MFTQGFAEVITDILTVNPAIRTIPSASAILDTSNYTFNAVTFGKDDVGFLYHAHALSSIDEYWPPFLDLYPYKANSGHIIAIRGNSTSPSSYHSSATHLLLSSIYNSVPNYPSIYDNRLERGNALTEVQYSISAISLAFSLGENPIFSYTPGDPALVVSSNIGHYINAIVYDNLLYSSLWNVIGGYPPSGQVSKYLLFDNNGSFVLSGNLSGVFNSKQIVDKFGFIKINEAINVTSVSGGPYITSGSGFPSNPGVILGVKLEKGDAVALALFGGVKHIGVWCLDLKQMLKSGLNPPYTWNYLNNNRKYKLVAKVTFWDDLLYNQDLGSTPGLSLLDTNGVLTKLKFNFK